MDLTRLKELASAIDLAELRLGAAELASRASAFEAPLPDAATLGLFVVLLLGLHRAHVRAARRSREALQAAYVAELVTANRLAHQARNELARARLEIERERQKKRRAERRAPARGDRPHSRPLSLVSDAADPRPTFA